MGETLRFRFCQLVVTAAFAAGTFSAAREARAQTATATVLPPLPGATESYAFGLNDASTVVGNSWTQGTDSRATVWLGAAPVLLDDGLSAPPTYATAIDNAGSVTGLTSIDGVPWVVIWTARPGGGWQMEQVAAGAWAVAASNDGVIAGWRQSNDGIKHAIVWERTSVGWVETDLGEGEPQDVNDLGQVVGVKSSPRTGYLWERTASGWTTTELGTRALGINNAGQVVGTQYFPFPARSTAAIWERVGGVWTATPLSPGESALDADRPADINDLGQVVGTRHDPEGWAKAVLWTSSSTGWSRQDLPDVGPGLYTARRINNRGAAIGQVRPNGSGYNTTVRWDIPTPSVPPVQAVVGLEAEVQAYVTWSVLSSQRAQGLVAKLDGVQRNLAKGNVTAARNQLTAFIREVEAAVSSGELSTEAGQALIDSANRVLAGL